MFNSPILDVAIGLVFIFLLYSLLITSVNEAVATLLGLRARMLRNGIVESMLANTPEDNRWMSLYKGVKEFFLEILKAFVGSREKPENEKKIGDKFFDHPLIKNYGSSRIFPIPSYIPTSNFSLVLIDVLKNEFNKRLDEISTYKFSISANNDTLEDIKKNLLYSSDILKIKEIIEYYGRHYATSNIPPPESVIDKETWQILHLHLKESIFNIEKFTQKIEGWFDDSMSRVSGWYKRQTQAILFLMGILVAILFNVDTIQISGKLSTDKDARDKMVQFATNAIDQYKDDPRVKKIADAKGNIIPDTSKTGMAANDSIFKQYRNKADSIRQFIDGDIKKANDILALGWGDYGRRRDSAKLLKKYEEDSACNLKEGRALITASSPQQLRKQVLDTIYEKHWIKYKVGYVIQQSTRAKKLLGFLITAFAICLGAPFWFDLLNKLVKLRDSGKKEDNTQSTAAATAAQQPVTVNVNTQSSGEEAVG